MQKKTGLRYTRKHVVPSVCFHNQNRFAFQSLPLPLKKLMALPLPTGYMFVALPQDAKDEWLECVPQLAETVGVKAFVSEVASMVAAANADADDDTLTLLLHIIMRLSYYYAANDEPLRFRSPRSSAQDEWEFLNALTSLLPCEAVVRAYTNVARHYMWMPYNASRHFFVMKLVSGHVRAARAARITGRDADLQRSLGVIRFAAAAFPRLNEKLGWILGTDLDANVVCKRAAHLALFGTTDVYNSDDSADDSGQE